MESDDYLFKTILIGDYNVGKGSLNFRYMYDTYEEGRMKIGIEFSK